MSKLGSKLVTADGDTIRIGDIDGTIFNVSKVQARQIIFDLIDALSDSEILKSAIELQGGDRENALVWMLSPMPQMQLQRPIDIIDSAVDRKELLFIIQMLINGIYF